MPGGGRAFARGLVIYAAGSLATALAPNLGILLLGWSLLEGSGAAPIMPAIASLVFGLSPVVWLLIGGMLVLYVFVGRISLFLSVVLELSALETGTLIFPLSAALMLAVTGIPKVRPQANPRRVVRLGFFLMIAGILMLVAGLDPDADAPIVAVPMLLMGFGLGAMSSQPGAFTASACRTRSPRRSAGSRTLPLTPGTPWPPKAGCHAWKCTTTARLLVE